MIERHDDVTLSEGHLPTNALQVLQEENTTLCANLTAPDDTQARRREGVSEHIPQIFEETADDDIYIRVEDGQVGPIRRLVTPMTPMRELHPRIAWQQIRPILEGRGFFQSEINLW